jgi:glycosyltransferase involved in cell wall biosynthesis
LRVLFLSTFYPPVAYGGYEVECAGVVERIARENDVRVLTCSKGRAEIAAEPEVLRELTLLSDDLGGALRAPRAALQAAAAARRALEWRPDLIYAWNGSLIPQAALRLFADSGTPLAFRVCEHWFGRLFAVDQFMRELLPARRGPGRAVWAGVCRGVNALPQLRLEPFRPLRAAISWNSEAIRRMAPAPSFLEPVLERVGHSVPRYGDLFEAIERSPAPEPEIVYLGRVSPYKGLSVAIEALALLRGREGIPASLVVIGPEDPGHGDELRALAERLGVSAAVQWRGPQSSEQAAAALSAAHALIVPSIWDEPFPLVTIEAALARVPIVAADVGGISEGMHDQEHALLFGRGDHEAAARALARTLAEADQTAARVLRARERAETYRIGPYLDAQERFVHEALEALRAGG